MKAKYIDSSIMIQPHCSDRTLNPKGWVLTFPILRAHKLIMPTKPFKTFNQALLMSLKWQRRLEKVTGKRIPIFMNDCRYSWLSPRTDNTIRYQEIA